MKKSVLDLTQDIPKSTQWARANKDIVAARDAARRKTLEGKLTYTVTNSKYRAKKRGWKHNLTVAYLRELYKQQEGKCALTGYTMSITGAIGTDDEWHSISVDRIDSTEGYTQDNVQLVCTGVNRLKGQMSTEQMFAFCKQIIEYNEV